jgi:hypothetical protein
MNTLSASVPASSGNKDSLRLAEAIRATDLGPALKRDRLLQRVRAARRRLPRTY